LQGAIIYMDTVLEYMVQNPKAMWVTIGGLLLVIEALVMGFSTGVLLFMGIGAWLTALLLYLGFDLSLQQQFFSFAIATTVAVLSLWKIFKNIHKTDVRQDSTSSDMIGISLSLKTEASTSSPGTIAWSGVTWQALLDPSVEAGTTLPAGSAVEVTAVAVGKLTVKPIQ
jgi:inner membrane protein